MLLGHDALALYAGKSTISIRPNKVLGMYTASTHRKYIATKAKWLNRAQNESAAHTCHIRHGFFQWSINVPHRPLPNVCVVCRLGLFTTTLRG
jgi:hypothetical protein